MSNARIKALIAAALLLAAAGCSEEGSPSKPYFEFAGGGFIFNYRLATADYGFVARVVREIPPGAVIEAEFENPAGGAPLIVRKTAVKRQLSYIFRTPLLQGIEADRDYHVRLRLLDAAGGKVIATYGKIFRADLSPDILPDRPLVAGPGYHRPKETE